MTLDHTKLFSLYGSWLRSLPRAVTAGASTISPFKLNDDSLSSSMSQTALLDNSSPSNGNAPGGTLGSSSLGISGSKGSLINDDAPICSSLSESLSGGKLSRDGALGSSALGNTLGGGGLAQHQQRARQQLTQQLI